MLIMLGLFLFNRETIARTLRDTQFLERIGKGANTPEPKDILPAVPKTEPKTDPKPEEKTPAKQAPAEKPVPTTEIKPAPEVKSDLKVSPEEKPVGKPEEKTAPATKPMSPVVTPKTPETKSVPQTRQRVIYFVIVDNSGTISRTMATRNLPNSDSPLADAITALIQGPAQTEKKKGYTSLIPPGTKLLSAIVRGNTAYLNFSEEFQFNSYGIEGYAAQLRQVIWTATEFSNVLDVQILIEGRRIDYLGFDGIWIGSPLNRDSF